MRLGTPIWRCRDRRLRRVVVVFSLLGYLAALVGYSAPLRVRKVSDKPFPCQHHACGCADAEQCWRHCCCYTPREKLAWARANHVTPPPDAEQISDEPQLAADDHQDGDHDDHDHHDHVAGCHHTQGDHTLADHDGAARLPHRCCTPHVRPAVDATDDESPGAQTSCPLAATDSSDEPAPVPFVVGEAWRNCRGLPTLWVTSGAAVPPPDAVCWQFSWDVVEWLSTPASDIYGGLLAPPVPPPRV